MSPIFEFHLETAFSIIELLLLRSILYIVETPFESFCSITFNKQLLGELWIWRGVSLDCMKELILAITAPYSRKLVFKWNFCSNSDWLKKFPSVCNRSLTRYIPLSFQPFFICRRKELLYHRGVRNKFSGIYMLSSFQSNLYICISDTWCKNMLLFSWFHFWSWNKLQDHHSPILAIRGILSLWGWIWLYPILMIPSQGSTFPGAQGHIPLAFAVGPWTFQARGHNSMYNNQKSCFWLLILINRPVRAPSLKS